MASDTDALQFDYSVGLSSFAQCRRGDVVHGNTGRSLSIEGTVVRVTVENGRHFESINRFF